MQEIVSDSIARHARVRTELCRKAQRFLCPFHLTDQHLKDVCVAPVKTTTAARGGIILVPGTPGSLI